LDPLSSQEGPSVAHRRKGIVAALAYALGVGSMVAWIDASAQEQQNQRILITVTGSNLIPRIEGETALPVQVITREQIEREGIQTAAELLNTVSANMSFNSFSETQAITGGSGQPGFAGASLRGLAYQKTLILFNGRRIANFALGTKGGDLNAIPLSAIDRVEVLKDGASAVYGADATAGVINFILRKDYQGAEAYAQYTSPQHTGGYSKRYNFAAGYGDLATQKFNAFAMVDYQEFGGIMAGDRPFSGSSYIPSEGVDKTNNSSVPANVDTPQGTRNPTGNPNNAYRNPTCLPPFSFPTNLSPNRCQSDYLRLTEVSDPSERLNLVGAFTWQLNPDNQFFVQGTYARNKFTFVAGPTAVSNATTFENINHFFLSLTSAFYPHAFAQFFGIDGKALNIRWRAFELGLRTDAPITEQWNVVAGMQGIVKGWNYNGAFSYNESDVTDRYVNGFLRESVLIPILNSGVVNPFGSNTPDVVALMSTAKLNQTVRTGKGSISSVDFHASNEIYQLPAGPLAFAAGAEAHQEKLAQVSDPVLESGDILNHGNVPSVIASRNVWALYAEANMPIVKTLEGNIAVRYDHYSDFGSTTNPKLSLRWQPTKTLLLRASAGTGFFVASLPGLYAPSAVSRTNNHDDPLRCPFTGSAQDCGATFLSNQPGNPLLQPEKSFQWGIGGVWSPVSGFSLGLDYFDILSRNRIHFISDLEVFQGCPDGIHGSTCQYFHRGPIDPNFPNLPGPISSVDSFLTNTGKQRLSGIDFNAQYLFPKFLWGQFKLTFNGTYSIKDLEQQVDGSYVNFINQERSPGVIPYWRHYLVFDWDYGPWSATLSENYQRGTHDEIPSTTNGTLPRIIGDYDIWNIGGAYAGFTNMTLSAGIKNLMDRNPPFSIQGGTTQVGFDPTYTDPHGRLYWAGIKYVFK
jgi:iron complex outermembrane recepter protein